MYDNNTLLSAAEVRILDVFLDLKRHYFAELVRVTRLTRPRTLRALRELVKQSILEISTEANVKFYSLKKNVLMRSTLSLVEYNRTLLFLDKNKTLARAVEMLKERYSDCSVMLIFGSAVKGYATKASDIDLLLLKEHVSQKDINKIEDVTDMINGRTGLKISPYLMTIAEFKKKNNLAKQAIDSHVLIDGAEVFFRIVFA